MYVICKNSVVVHSSNFIKEEKKYHSIKTNSIQVHSIYFFTKELNTEARHVSFIYYCSVHLINYTLSKILVKNIKNKLKSLWLNQMEVTVYIS